MSFEIIDSSWQNTGGRGFLFGFYGFDDIIDRKVVNGDLTLEEGEDMKAKYDGYQIQIDGYNSVNYYLNGNIEAICLHSNKVGGGHCAGLRYNNRANEGDPWGLWFTTAQYREAKDFGSELKGINISDQWAPVDPEEKLDAALGGGWRIKKWLPKESEVYVDDYRWSKADTPPLERLESGVSRTEAVVCDSDVEGFYYEWNGGYYRIVVADRVVCINQAVNFGTYAMVAAVAALLISF